MEFFSDKDKEEYLKLSPTKRIEWLKEYSKHLNRGTALNEVQKLLFDLEMEDRSYSAMEPRDHIDLHRYDVLIGDITEESFRKIGDTIGIHRLTPATNVGTFPIGGILFGTANRVFVPLVVTKRNISLNVLFLVDTAAPATFLREDTLIALGHSEAIPPSTRVRINEVIIDVEPSRGHFTNIDLLGQDFFSRAGATLFIDYKTLEMVLDCSKAR